MQEVEPIEIPKITPEQFCDTLRDIGRALASGKKDSIEMPQDYPKAVLENGAKIDAGYMRSIINRVPEVKEKGVMSIKKRTDDEGRRFWLFTINENKKRRVITDQDLPAIRVSAANKALSRLLAISPDITDLDGEALQGANVALRRMKDLIKNMMEEE